jgi:hypothetical protein
MAIQESTYSYLFNQNGFLQVINLVLIATGLFRFKGNTAFDFHFMSTQSLYYLSHGSI